MSKKMKFLGWMPWRDGEHGMDLLPMEVFENKSVAECALHRHVHYNDRRFTGIFYNCEEELAKLGWRLREVFVKEETKTHIKKGKK